MLSLRPMTRIYRPEALTAAPSPDAPVRRYTIAAIGDVHDQWNEDDNRALEALGVELALFVGDFGNEAVPIVRTIAALAVPKAVILGNHDAWYSASPWGQKRCPYDRRLEDRVQQQLDLLGGDHVGYGSKAVPRLGLSVVGGRPFSWGGDDWKNPDFYRDRYGIHSFAESGDRITATAIAAPHPHLIFLAHNGPFGLGAEPEDPCGRDWQPRGGDFGDPDLTAAIKTARDRDRQVSLVVFGHMHHRLRHRSDRLRQIVQRDAAGTIYLNAACVPRHQILQGTPAHQFITVTYCDHQIDAIDQIWVDRSGQPLETRPLYRSAAIAP
ncbi:MAG: hypothetical protein Fur0042_02600 [Cyanophyceae cyanobacterium]